MAVSTLDGGSAESITFPRQTFRHYLAMSNELSTPKIVLCPSDRNRVEATVFSTNALIQTPGITVTPFQGNINISYFVGVDADETKPQCFLGGDRNLTNSVGLGERQPMHPCRVSYRAVSPTDLKLHTRGKESQRTRLQPHHRTVSLARCHPMGVGWTCPITRGAGNRRLSVSIQAGGRIVTEGIGSTQIAAGTGTRIIPGAGARFITADGFARRNAAGAGSRARSGGRPGSAGASRRIIVAGLPCRRELVSPGDRGSLITAPPRGAISGSASLAPALPLFPIGIS